MSLSPLCLPTIPPYYRMPEELESALASAMDQRMAVEAALAAINVVPDPSFDQFLRQTHLEISLAAAKMASSFAVCQIQDWLDEVDP